MAITTVSDRERGGLVPDETWPSGGGRATGYPDPVRARRGPAVCTEAHPPDLHGSRLTPRGRLVVAAIWLVMAVAAVLMVVTIPSDSDGAPLTTKVMVEPGETLSQLAGQVQPGEDRQETIAAILSMNGLESASQIQPGDILIVPVEP